MRAAVCTLVGVGVALGFKRRTLALGKRLACLHLLAIVNSDAMNVSVW